MRVSATLVVAAEVLIVPNEALVSLIDGSYAVQVVLPDGTDRFVTVQVLAATASKAAIEGGDRVRAFAEDELTPLLRGSARSLPRLPR